MPMNSAIVRAPSRPARMTWDQADAISQIDQFRRAIRRMKNDIGSLLQSIDSLAMDLEVLHTTTLQAFNPPGSEGNPFVVEDDE